MHMIGHRQVHESNESDAATCTDAVANDAANRAGVATHAPATAEHCGAWTWHVVNWPGTAAADSTAQCHVSSHRSQPPSGHPHVIRQMATTAQDSDSGLESPDEPNSDYSSDSEWGSGSDDSDDDDDDEGANTTASGYVKHSRADFTEVFTWLTVWIMIVFFVYTSESTYGHAVRRHAGPLALIFSIPVRPNKVPQTFRFSPPPPPVLPSNFFPGHVWADARQP